MSRHRKQPTDPEKESTKKVHQEKQGEGTAGNACRCEDVSKKTFPELLRLMLSDLAFWKRVKQK